MKRPKTDQKLRLLRERMDRLDQKLARLMSTRLELSHAIINEKRRQGLPAHDPKRERAVLNRLKASAANAAEARLVAKVYAEIFKVAVATSSRK